MRALVLSGSNTRGAFAAIRRLHQAGWVVSVGTADPGGLVAWSRATDAVYAVPPPERGIEHFLEALAAAVRASGAEVVFPSDDADLIALSAGRALIPAVVPLASDGIVNRMVDKLELVRIAKHAGMAAPDTRQADDQGFEEARYPVVVKARFHWQPEHAASAPARIAAAVCADRDSATRHAKLMRQHGADPLLQQHMDGTPIYVHLVADRAGAVIGLDQQEGEKRYFPPGAGLRVRSVTVPPDPQLASGVRRLIADNGWFGFAGITFLRPDRGVPHLIDFNGRIPAALEASAGAGPNYMATWAALATNRPVAPLREARPGTRFQWLEGDLRRSLHERRGGLVRDIAGSLAYSIGATHTVLKRDEPLAALRLTVRQIRLSRRRG